MRRADRRPEHAMTCLEEAQPRAVSGDEERVSTTLRRPGSGRNLGGILSHVRRPMTKAFLFLWEPSSAELFTADSAADSAAAAVDPSAIVENGGAHDPTPVDLPSPLAGELAQQTAPASAENEGNEEEEEEEEEEEDALDGECDGEDAQEAEGVVGTLEDAQRLFDEGCHSLRSQDYGQAAELLSRSLEIRYSVKILSFVS